MLAVAPDVEIMTAFAVGCVLFFLTIQSILSWRKVPQTQISCIISLVHHVSVTVYCLSCNYSFMTLLHSSFLSSVLPCDARLYSTPSIYYSGIFTIVYLAFDMLFDLVPNMSKNKLLIFHHINGVVLVWYSLITHYGEYMVYICHIMEISSIFLSIKELLKFYEAPEGLKLANDMAFAFSFLVVRIYVTLASVFMLTGMYNNDCFQFGTLTLLDVLIMYTTVLYCVLTTFWSCGIIKKMYGVVTGRRGTHKTKTQ